MYVSVWEFANRNSGVQKQEYTESGCHLSADGGICV